MTTKFDELIAKLKEIFQIDKPELDFGIYKIYVLLKTAGTDPASPHVPLAPNITL